MESTTEQQMMNETDEHPMKFWDSGDGDSRWIRGRQMKENERKKRFSATITVLKFTLRGVCLALLINLIMWDGANAGNVTEHSRNKKTGTFKGEKGEAGLPGVVSEDGIPLPWVKGDKGDQGIKGDHGSIGRYGKRGPKGDGIKGPKGQTGTGGLKGSKGNVGSRGFTGNTGYKGIKGSLGTTGNKGQKGVKGDVSNLQDQLNALRRQLAGITGVRLVGGLTPNYGRVEIRHHGVWGTICDDAWDINDARVICRMLRFGSAYRISSGASHGSGSGRIWLDDLNCSGDESSVSSCRGNRWGAHDCSHSEDASAHCRT